LARWYFAEVTANVPNGTTTTHDDAPWLYTTLHAPEVADALGVPPAQLRTKAKGAFLRSALDGTQVRTIFDRLTSDDYGWRGATAVFVSWGGKINAFDPEDTAVAERDSIALFSVANVWDDPVPNERTGGCFINWPDPDLRGAEWNRSGVPWSELYYGGNYAKLQEAKRRWDPHQVFSHALAIEPG
jgi:Berberine and berberine like